MFSRMIVVCSLALVASACAVSPANAPVGNNTAVEAPPPAPTAVPIVSVGAITADAMYAAEALYNVPAHAYVTADSRGLLPASVKAATRPFLIEAHKHLVKARGYYGDYVKYGKIVDAVGFWNERDEIEDNANKANKLLPKSGG